MFAGINAVDFKEPCRIDVCWLAAGRSYGVGDRIDVAGDGDTVGVIVPVEGGAVLARNVVGLNKMAIKSNATAL